MNCIIVDDEPLAREGMQDLVATQPTLQLLHSFNSTFRVVDFIKENPVDLIFLDIEMPGTNGIEFARSIPNKTLVIFTTAYSQYALESYEVEAIDYLVKPISVERFEKAVEKAASYLSLIKSRKNDFEGVVKNNLIVRADRRYHKIAFDDIYYIEGLKDYVIIYTRSNKYVTWMNLKTIHSKLPESIFLRVNKSYIVNQNAITSFDNTTVYINEIEIDIGKSYQSDFNKNFLGGTLP